MNISSGEEIVNLKQDIKSYFLTHSGLKWAINKKILKIQKLSLWSLLF